MSRARTLLLWAAATDRTFTLVGRRPDRRLEGKCIFCRRKLAIAVDRDERHPTATVEHILPRAHGGTDALENLAVACRRCNGGKGVRLDPAGPGHPTFDRVVERLQAERAKRRRDPPEELDLGPEPT